MSYRGPSASRNPQIREELTVLTLRPPASIGFIGLGNMGRPMARRLGEAGYRLHLADKNESVVRSFVAAHGGTAYSTPEALARSVDAVITMLPDGKIVREVSLGDAGLVAGLAPGSVVMDMSSSDPVGTRELGAA